jgi:LmbE family N-acetylglucosaminyl deacetylase
MLESLRNKRIMLVVAHPDDELLGVGATIHRLVQEFNCTVKTVILGEGITSRSDTRDTEQWRHELAIHQQNILNAQKSIAYQELSVYQFPDNRFDSISLLDIVKTVEKEKETFCPDVIFTHHCGDLNIDHQKTCEAVVTACRPMQDEKVKTIICFETPSGTEWRSSADPKHFIPNFFVKISESDLNAKIKGMEAYKFEKRTYPHPRSPEALTVLSQYRGLTIGEKFAEAFVIIRTIN